MFAHVVVCGPHTLCCRELGLGAKDTLSGLCALCTCVRRFGTYAWVGADDPSLLDVRGSELLLVGARQDPGGEGRVAVRKGWAHVAHVALAQEGDWGDQTARVGVSAESSGWV